LRTRQRSAHRAFVGPANISGQSGTAALSPIADVPRGRAATSRLATGVEWVAAFMAEPRCTRDPAPRPCRDSGQTGSSLFPLPCLVRAELRGAPVNRACGCRTSPWRGAPPVVSGADRLVNASSDRHLPTAGGRELAPAAHSDRAPISQVRRLVRRVKWKVDRGQLSSARPLCVEGQTVRGLDSLRLTARPFFPSCEAAANRSYCLRNCAASSRKGVTTRYTVAPGSRK
jgi:hypothetical protein